MRIRLSWFGALGVLIAVPRLAAADDCPDFTSMNPIYLNGSSAAEPLVKIMGPVLATQTQPTTLVYAKPGSCVGVTSVNEDTPTGTCTNGACFTGAVEYWNATGALVTCTLTVPTHVDVGLSDVWVDTCTGAQPKAGVKDVTGPVEPMLFVVPKNSPQTAITAEEAYFVFGFGATGRVQPWSVEANLAIRNPTSGTEQVIAHNINVPAGRWKGMDKGGSGGVLTAVMNATAVESTLGILGSDVYDANRGVLKSLAFQGYHQFGAFYADSTATSFDKRNVRNGHYVNWGYLHMITRLDASNNVTPSAKKFIDWVTGNTGATGTASPFADITDSIIKANMVPVCAMKVQRQSEGGAISPFTPAADCSAQFEATVPH